MATSLGLSNLSGAPPASYHPPSPHTTSDIAHLPPFIRRAYRPEYNRSFTFPTSSSRDGVGEEDGSGDGSAGAGGGGEVRMMSTLDVLAAAAAACLPSTSTSRAPTPPLHRSPSLQPHDYATLPLAHHHHLPAPTGSWHPTPSPPPYDADSPMSYADEDQLDDDAQRQYNRRQQRHDKQREQREELREQRAKLTPRRVILRLPTREPSDLSAPVSRSASPATTAGTGGTPPPRDTPPPLIRRRPPRTRLPVPTPNVSRPSRGRHVPTAPGHPGYASDTPSPPIPGLWSTTSASASPPATTTTTNENMEDAPTIAAIVAASHALQQQQQRQQTEDEIESPVPPRPLQQQQQQQQQEPTHIPKVVRLKVVTKDQMRDELAARVFVCEVEGCGKCFRRREHLKRHMLSLHTNDRPFRCPDCDKVCNRRDNLVQHRKIHAQDAAKI